MFISIPFTGGRWKSQNSVEGKRITQSWEILSFFFSQSPFIPSPYEQKDGIKGKNGDGIRGLVTDSLLGEGVGESVAFRLGRSLNRNHKYHS